MSGRLPTPTWRTLALQASFNLRGMQRTGWWFALVPWLRRMDGEGRARWFATERAVFNSNPYLAPVLLGARCRIEEDQGAEMADRVEATMQRTLGALGDALFWRAARPVWFLGCALAGIAFGPVAVLLLWLAFVVLVVSVHRAGQSWGYRLGLEVVDRLASNRLHAIARAGRRVAAILAGAVAAGTVTLALATGAETLAAVAAAVALATGFVVSRIRRGPEWVLVAVMAGLLLFARFTGEFPEAVITWR